LDHLDADSRKVMTLARQEAISKRPFAGTSTLAIVEDRSHALGCSEAASGIGPPSVGGTATRARRRSASGSIQELAPDLLKRGVGEAERDRKGARAMCEWPF